MAEKEPTNQLRMRWPRERLTSPPAVTVPSGYGLRSYRPGDEPRFLALMDLAGWPGWHEDLLRHSLSRILPGGWFLAVHGSSGELVASAMALHNYSGQNPFQGDLGWVAADPAHRGHGLGRAVTAAATARLIAAGYTTICLGTEDWRIPALRLYLRLGYVPVLHTADMPERWAAICRAADWPFTPDRWPT